MDPGNYTQSEFKHAFENKIRKINRVNNYIPHGSTNHIILDINSKSEKVKFTSYTKHNNIIFVKSTNLTTINKEHTNNISLDCEDQDQGSSLIDNTYYQYPTGNYFKMFPNINIDRDSIRIKIHHPNNNVKVNDKILISKSLNFGKIPEKYLNGFHIVTRVSGDHYDIILNNVNMDNNLDSTIMGGNEITIMTPNIFRIRFDYHDTIGKILGFRDVGEYTSITPYSFILTNNTFYENKNTDILTNLSINKGLQFEGPQYILIKCSQIPFSFESKNLGVIKDYFYRIDLCGLNNTYIYKSFVKSPIRFNDPLKQLSELNIDIYSPDGSYYDFNGKNHSFVLEIITYNELPVGTCIGS